MVGVCSYGMGLHRVHIFTHPVLNGEGKGGGVGGWAEGGTFIVRCGRVCCLVMDVMAVADVVIMQNFGCGLGIGEG